MKKKTGERIGCSTFISFELIYSSEEERIRNYETTCICLPEIDKIVIETKVNNQERGKAHYSFLQFNFSIATFKLVDDFT